MKAHLPPLPIPPKYSAAESSISHQPPDEEDNVSKPYVLKKRRNLSDLHIHEGESEMEARRLTRRRLRRKVQPEPVSSVSHTSTEEEEDASIAVCLVMLSRDTRAEQRRHRCEICNKVFRSSQALGGHRVTHRKFDRPDKSRRKTAVDEKLFKCPYCYRVFGSGQALGGHKRSHVKGSASAGASASVTLKTSGNLLDLNLPAPEEDDDGSVVSYAAITDQPVKTDH